MKIKETETMKKNFRLHHFTLVEMLIVVGIIAVLAGLVLPAVIGGIQNGRITQAKSDISAIIMAVKGVEGTYGKMVKSPYTFGGKTLTASNNAISFSSFKNGALDKNSDGYVAYQALIAELTVPGNSKLTARNINTRKIKFLDPKPSFDPTKNYDDAANLPHLWLDPWGNPYVILLNVSGEDKIVVSTSKTIAARVAVYSAGPNGTDDGGCNVDLGTCISSGTHKLHDDITSWD